MSSLIGQVGEMRATISITRKATGKVDTFEIIGAVTQEQLDALVAEAAAKKQPMPTQLELPI
jgi:hypothetical protein